MTPQEENALRLELEKMQQTLFLMRQLGTREGFFQYYFKKINQFKNREQCFHSVNELYKNLYGEYRYSDYGSFRNTLNRATKNEK